MAAKTARLSATHDKSLDWLGWAPPLFALGLFAGLGIVRHTEGRALEKAPAAAAETSRLAGAGSAMLSNAYFH